MSQQELKNQSINIKQNRNYQEQTTNVIITRSRKGLGLQAASDLVENKRARVVRPECELQLWTKKIPYEAGLRTSKYIYISDTMLWPRTSSLDAESLLVEHFLKYASMLGGSMKLESGSIITSEHGAFYNGIVRYKDKRHRSVSLRKYRNDPHVHEYLEKTNVSVSTGVQDIRYYMGRFKNPLAVLIGEGETSKRYPHCVCLIFRYYNGKWEAISKDSANVDNKDMRPNTKLILNKLNFDYVYYVPLSVMEAQKESVNCVGQAISAGAQVLEGNLYTIIAHHANSCIWQFNLEKDQFEPNSLNGIVFCLAGLEDMDVVEFRDNKEIRAQLQNFRATFSQAAIELDKKIKILDSEREWYVQSIKEKRIVNGKLEYKVHWQGYPSDDDTFEPTTNLDNCKKLVIAFEESLKDNGANDLIKLRNERPEWF